MRDTSEDDTLCTVCCMCGKVLNGISIVISYDDATCEFTLYCEECYKLIAIRGKVN
jgi:hypothetical protein